MVSGVEWEFVLDEDEIVIMRAPVGTSENLRLALETLVIPFGLRRGAAEDFLEQYWKMEREFQTDYSIGTSSASVKRLSPDLVEFVDFYGQFENCTMGEAEFVNVMVGFGKFIDSLS